VPELPWVSIQGWPVLIPGIIFLYGFTVLLITTVFLAVRIMRTRLHLPTVRTRDQLLEAFGQSRMQHLASRILDLAPSEWPFTEERIVIQSPLNAGRAARQFAHLYKAWLARTHFFTGFAVLLAMAALSWGQHQAPEGVASHTSGFGSSADQMAGLTQDPYVQQSSTTPASRPWRSRTILRLLAAVLTLTLSLSSVYFLLGKAHPKSDQALLEQSRELSERLLPVLEGAAIADLPQIGLQLEKIDGKGTTIKLLLAPAGDERASFYFVASWPVRSPEGGAPRVNQ